MARRRRRHGSSDSDEPKPPTATADATTSLRDLLKAANVSAARPMPARATAKASAGGAVAQAPLPPARPGKPSAAAELRMLNDAYAGVQPLQRKQARKIVVPSPDRRRIADEDRAAEAAARKRLSALVAGGIHFKVRCDDGFVVAHRREVAPKLVARLGGKGFAPDATLDLHGEIVARVSDVVAGFVRGHHRKGAKQLLVIVGKGLHSEDGQGVLLPALIDALTHGGAAPLVRCFASAHATLGGSGAVAVQLV